MGNAVSIKIVTSPTIEFQLWVQTPSRAAGSVNAAVGIPRTSQTAGNALRDITSLELFGTGKTASRYTVNGNSLNLQDADENALALLELRRGDRNALFVQAGSASGLLLYSDNNLDPAVDEVDWVKAARIVDGGTYTASTGEGVGSTLTFTLSRSEAVNEIRFGQGSGTANQIPNMQTGNIILGTAFPDLTSNGYLPGKRVDNTNASDPALVVRNISTDVLSIRIRNNGEQLLVTYLPGRNNANNAPEVEVTYNRPTS